MPEDYLSDGDAQTSGAAPDDGGGQDDESKDQGQTAIVPSELCPGMKVGDTMTVKIVSVDEDSYEISYVDKGKGGDEETGPGEGQAQVPEGSMQSMLE